MTAARLRHSPLILAALALASCSSADGRPGAPTSDAGNDVALLDAPNKPDVTDASLAADVFGPDASDVAPADVASAYPAGPYGNAVGSVLADMRFEGYVNPGATGIASATPFTTTSMRELRGDGRGYGLVFIAEFY